jgi:predicted ATPase
MSIVRIAVSGGPGAGKTTLWQAVADAHSARVIAVPEVATLLFSHVFPQVQSEPERHAVQRAIFSVQHNLEQVYESRLGPGQVLWCDRGAPDGGGYWPEGCDHFFESMQTEWRRELSRYAAVLFLESAAVGGMSISDGNHTRTEDLATAVELDRRLQEVWSAHPNFHVIPAERDFSIKISRGLALAQALLNQLGCE